MPERVDGFDQVHVSGTGGGPKYGNVLVTPFGDGMDWVNHYDYREYETIHDIDTGKARGYSRALFVSSILNKVSTYAGKGEVEIHPDPRYLLPDSTETLKATEKLVKLGFVVLPYCQADPTLCKRLEEAGAATVSQSASLTISAAPLSKSNRSSPHSPSLSA